MPVIARATSSRDRLQPAGRQRGRAPRLQVGLGGRGPGGLPGGVGDEHHVASQEPDLQDGQQQEQDDGQEQGQLHRRLALVVGGRAADGSRHLLEHPVDDRVRAAG